MSDSPLPIADCGHTFVVRNWEHSKQLHGLLMPDTPPLDGAAFLALLHHVVFTMTPKQAAALMADDEPITAAPRNGPPSVARQR